MGPATNVQNKIVKLVSELGAMCTAPNARKVILFKVASADHVLLTVQVVRRLQFAASAIQGTTLLEELVLPQLLSRTVKLTPVLQPVLLAHQGIIYLKIPAIPVAFCAQHAQDPISVLVQSVRILLPCLTRCALWIPSLPQITTGSTSLCLQMSNC